MDVARIPSAPRIRLHPQGMPDAPPEGAIREGIHVFDPPALLASAGEERIGPFGLATQDYHVAAGHGEAPAILVPARLERDVVVSRTERAAPDHHAVARLRIAGVAVRARARGGDAVDRHVRAKRRVQLPELRTGDAHSLDEHARATQRFDRRGPQAAHDDPVSGRRALGHERLELPRAVAAPVPGSRGGGVQGAAAGEGDVRLLEGVDHRRAIDARSREESGEAQSARGSRPPAAREWRSVAREAPRRFATSRARTLRRRRTGRYGEDGGGSPRPSIDSPNRLAEHPAPVT